MLAYHIHIQKDKKTYQIFRNKNTLTFDHGQFVSYINGENPFYWFIPLRKLINNP